MVHDVAKDWFAKHAFFNVPPWEPPTTDISFSGLKRSSVDLLNKHDIPVFAFEDRTKVDRLVQIADQVLGDRHLEVSDGNRRLRGAAARRAYEELFSPAVESKYGVKYDEWEWISSEVDCVRLVRRGPMYAVKSVLKRLFNVDIKTYPERRNHGITRDNSRERVNIAVKDVDDRSIYLIEGKAPAVLNKLVLYLSTDSTHVIDLTRSGSLGEGVLNKAIYHMCLWNYDHMILTSFKTVYFLQLHRDSALGPCVSYSKPLEQHGNSGVFRALLGLTFVQLNRATLDDPDIDKRAQIFLKQTKRREAHHDDDLRIGPGAGPDSGPSSGPSAHYSFSSERGSGASRKYAAGASNRSTERRSGNSVLQPYATTNDEPSIASRRVTIPMSRRLESWQKTDVRDTAPVIKIGDCSYFTSGLLESAEFDLETEVKFPSFPTSDEVPFLKVVEAVGSGATSIVYKAELQHPDASNDSSYAIKLVDAEWRSSSGYRNYITDLRNEYINYCLFELGKRYRELKNIINQTTATCYGLYRFRDRLPCSPPKFVLIMEYLGERVPEGWHLDDSEKCAVLDSLICLHSLGLHHGDPDERNVVFDAKSRTFKFIDLCDSTWHKCRGIGECKELKIMWMIFKLFDKGSPSQFQEKVVHDHHLLFRNLQKLLEQAKEVDMENLAPRLKVLAEELDPEM